MVARVGALLRREGLPRTPVEWRRPRHTGALPLPTAGSINQPSKQAIIHYN